MKQIDSEKKLDRLKIDKLLKTIYSNHTTEEINSQFYFVRARNNQYNYTNNESFVDNDKNIRRCYKKQI